VGAVRSGSPAEEVGIRPGDLIYRVADREVKTWEAFYVQIGTRANRDVPLSIIREGQELTVNVTPEPQTRFEVGEIGVMPDVNPRVTAVESGQPAERAGFRPGDVIVAADGEPITFSSQLIDHVQRHGERPMTIEVQRDGAPVSLTVEAVRREDTLRIGIGLEDEFVTIDPGPLQAIGLSIQRNIQFSGLIIETVWGLITRQTSPRQLMGPVAIAQLSGEYAQAGWISFLTLMASISLNLGLLNLLPIPVLDGGHIFIMMLEGVSRRDFSIRVKEKMLLAGFVLLMLLMVTVIYNDLTRIQWIENLMPWR
jgi:regulator of sigma E protease